MNGKISAKCGNDDKPDISDAVHDRPHDAAVNIRSDACCGELIRSFAEFSDGARLMIVGNHRAVSADHLLHRAVQLPQEHLALPRKFPHLPGKDFGRNQRQKHSRAAEQRQLPAIPQHDRHRPHDRQHARKQRRQRLRNRRGNVFDIVGHAAHDVSVGVGIQICHRQIRNFIKQLLPHPFYNSLAEPRAEYALQQLAAAVQQIDAQHEGQHGQHFALIRAGNSVDGFALQAGRQNAAKRSENHNGQHAENQLSFPDKIPGNSLERSTGMLRMLCLHKMLMAIHAGNIALRRLLFFLFTHLPLLPLQSANHKYPDRRHSSPATHRAYRLREFSRFPAR